MTPKLILSIEVHHALSKLCADNPKEWSMICKTERIEDNFHVTDFFIPEQENDGASTEFTTQNLCSDIATQDDDLQSWNLWLHSHNKMGCFWSSTDREQMETFGQTGMPFLLSLVVSTKDAKNGFCDTLACLSIFTPIRVDLTIPVVTQDQESALSKELQARLDEKQKFPVPKYPLLNKHGKQSKKSNKFDWDDWDDYLGNYSDKHAKNAEEEFMKTLNPYEKSHYKKHGYLPTY